MSPTNEGWHLYSNGMEWIVGKSIDEALTAYAEETGDCIGGDIAPADEWSQVPDDKPVSIYFDGESKTLTAQEWCMEVVLNPRPDGIFTRCVFATDW